MKIKTCIVLTLALIGCIITKESMKMKTESKIFFHKIKIQKLILSEKLIIQIINQ